MSLLSWFDCQAVPSCLWLPMLLSPKRAVTAHLAMLMELAPLSSAAEGRRGGGGGRAPLPLGLGLLAGLLPLAAGLPPLARCSCTVGSCDHCRRVAAPLLSVVVVLLLDAGHSTLA